MNLPEQILGGVLPFSEKSLFLNTAILETLTNKEAAAFEAPSQTKEEFSGNDTSRHPKVFKLGPKLGYQ